MLVLVSVAIAALAYLLMIYPRRAAGGSGESFVLTVEDGTSPATLVARLAEEDVVAHPRLFSAYLRLTGGDDVLRSGTILLARNLTPEEVARRIAHGRGAVPRRVTIPEGFNRFDVAERLELVGVCAAEDFLVVTESAPEGIEASSFEGYLFPDTYDFVEGTPAGEVAQQMRRNWGRRVTALLDEEAGRLEALRADLGWTMHEVLTLASVVEKEAAVPEERAVIAGVFLNRLRSESFRPRHRLQADPTVTYGCLEEPERAASCAGFDGRRITRAMLDDSDNRYNTYRHGGLPPGPIANPGLAAMRAVLRPAEHDYLYFVARGGGRHQFSRELGAHENAVDRYQR